MTNGVEQENNKNFKFVALVFSFFLQWAAARTCCQLTNAQHWSCTKLTRIEPSMCDCVCVCVCVACGKRRMARPKNKSTNKPEPKQSECSKCDAQPQSISAMRRRRRRHRLPAKLPHVAVASWRQADRLAVIDLQFLLQQLFGCKEIYQICCNSCQAAKAMRQTKTAWSQL